MLEDVSIAIILQIYPDAGVEMVHETGPPRVIGVGEPVDDEA